MTGNEKLREVQRLMAAAQGLLKEDFSVDLEKIDEINKCVTFELRSGCFEALVALSTVIEEELNGADSSEKRPQYVVNTLLSSILQFSKHYKISFEDAIERSGLIPESPGAGDELF